MCGFTGFISREDIDNQTVIEKMADRIKHRGPDDEGYFVDQNVSMGLEGCLLLIWLMALNQ